MAVALAIVIGLAAILSPGHYDHHIMKPLWPIAKQIADHGEKSLSRNDYEKYINYESDVNYWVMAIRETRDIVAKLKNGESLSVPVSKKYEEYEEVVDRLVAEK